MYKMYILSCSKSNLQSETFSSSVVWCGLGDRCMKIPLRDAFEIMPLGLAGQTMVTRMYVT